MIFTLIFIFERLDAFGRLQSSRYGYGRLILRHVFVIGQTDVTVVQGTIYESLNWFLHKMERCFFYDRINDSVDDAIGGQGASNVLQHFSLDQSVRRSKKLHGTGNNLKLEYYSFSKVPRLKADEQFKAKFNWVGLV